jgi:hypothetical protein
MNGRVVMKKLIILSLVSMGFSVAIPVEVNALDLPTINQNFRVKTNLRVAQVHPPYQIGYTVHYRSSRDRKWTLEGFHLERRNVERAARRLRRLGFRAEVRWRSLSE